MLSLARDIIHLAFMNAVSDWCSTSLERLGRLRSSTACITMLLEKFGRGAQMIVSTWKIVITLLNSTAQ